MGQKINPTGFRLPVTHDWTSRWYATGRDFARTLAEDLKVRDYLGKKLKNASVGRILIERPAKNARITIFSARPGVVIGKKGEDIEVLKAELQKLMGVPVHVNIEEIRRPDLDAQLIADSITQQLEKRIMFRRVDVASLFTDTGTAAFCSCRETTESRGFLNIDRSHTEFVNVCTVVVFGIGNSRIESFADDAGSFLLRERKNVQGLVNGLTADKIRNQTAFLSREANSTYDCCGFHCYYLLAGAAFLSAAWPLKVRVNANSPSLWPTMFSLIKTGTC
jgi:hypothetical protein